MYIRRFIVSIFINFYYLDCCFAIDCGATPKGPNDHLTRLQVDVICKSSEYDVRPVKVNTTVTTVDIIFKPKHISIVENKELVKIIGYMTQSWKDENSIWKPSDYGSIRQVEVDYYDLWHPKLTSTEYYMKGWYEFIDESNEFNMREMKIKFDGSVSLNLAVTVFGPCTFDFSNWPNEEWHCELTLGKKIEEDGYVAVHFQNSSVLDISMLENDKNWEIIQLTDPAVTNVDSESDYVDMKIQLKRQCATIERVFLIPALISLGITIIPFWLTNKIFIRLFIHFVATAFQITLLQSVFSFVSKDHGLRSIGLYDLYLEGLLINLIGIIITAINAKFGTNVEDPPKFIVSFLSMLAHIPYLGVYCSIIMNNDIEYKGDFGSDEETLLASKVKYNPKWRAFLNFIDTSVLYFIILFFCIKML